jgi:hypothetical protein
MHFGFGGFDGLLSRVGLEELLLRLSDALGDLLLELGIVFAPLFGGVNIGRRSGMKRDQIKIPSKEINTIVNILKQFFKQLTLKTI